MLASITIETIVVEELEEKLLRGLDFSKGASSPGESGLPVLQRTVRDVLSASRKTTIDT